MRILVFEPLKEPYVKDIEDDIQAMQEVVGGSIEPIYFESDGKALAWCNDEFLLNGSKPNRIVGNTLVRAIIVTNTVSGIPVHLPMNR